ncbi:MAG: hypothetical protein ACXV3D_03400 [Halobacteriota archaeon]
MSKTNVQTGAEIRLESTISFSLAIRHNSSLLIDAAIRFINESFEIEHKYDENAPNYAQQDKISSYCACVIGALFTSIAFLEASINDVFLDAIDCLPKKHRKDAKMKNGRRKKFASNLVIPSNLVSSYRNNTLSPAVVRDMAQLW